MIGMSKYLYDGLNWVNGGDFMAYKNNWRTFLASLKAAGIKLMFTVDGFTPGSKPGGNGYKKLKIFVYPTFNALEKGQKSVCINNFLPHLMFMQMFRYNQIS
jgi:hypothetical protein